MIMRFCPSQWLFIILVVLLGVSSMLSACGKKGPLYLPEQKAQTSEQNKQAEPTKGAEQQKP